MTDYYTDVRIFDLGKFANELKRRSQHKPLIQAIWDALDTHSAQGDLHSASDATTALRNLHSRDLPDLESHAIALALLSNAIILYSRATATKQTARKTFDIRARFDSEQKVVHQELYDLRNDAIAHFGTGKSYSGPSWIRETALFCVGPEGSRVGISTRRFTFDAGVVDRISAQIDAARKILEDLRKEKSVACATVLNRALKGNTELLTLLCSFPFDPSDFHGGDAETDAFYASLQSGHERVFVVGGRQHGEWLPPRH